MGLYSNFATLEVDRKHLAFQPQYPLWTSCITIVPLFSSDFPNRQLACAVALTRERTPPEQTGWTWQS